MSTIFCLAESGHNSDRAASEVKLVTDGRRPMVSGFRATGVAAGGPHGPLSRCFLSFTIRPFWGAAPRVLCVSEVHVIDGHGPVSLGRSHALQDGMSRRTWSCKMVTELETSCPPAVL